MTDAALDTEEVLLDHFRAGDETAFKWLFDRHYGAILYYAQHILERRTDAEDIVQEIFVTLWRKRSDFNSLDHIKNFLYKSTRFACINQLRQWQSRDRQVEVLLQRALNDSFSDARLVEEEIFQAVIAEINALPEKYATILQLRYLHDLDYRQIAEKMGVSEATIRKQKQRAIELLQTAVVKKQLISATAVLTVLARLHL
jgi:RNA polymerase sigma-70 factor (family 1)